MSRNVPRLIGTCLLVLASSIAIAQPAKKAENRSISKELDVWVAKTEEQLVPAADAMPEEKHGFTPAAGAFDGVRTFAEQVKHLAATNYIKLGPGVSWVRSCAPARLKTVINAGDHTRMIAEKTLRPRPDDIFR